MSPNGWMAPQSMTRSGWTVPPAAGPSRRRSVWAEMSTPTSSSGRRAGEVEVGGPDDLDSVDVHQLMVEHLVEERGLAGAGVSRGGRGGPSAGRSPSSGCCRRRGVTNARRRPTRTTRPSRAGRSRGRTSDRPRRQLADLGAGLVADGAPDDPGERHQRSRTVRLASSRSVRWRRRPGPGRAGARRPGGATGGRAGCAGVDGPPPSGARVRLAWEEGEAVESTDHGHLGSWTRTPTRTGPRGARLSGAGFTGAGRFERAVDARADAHARTAAPRQCP